MSDTTQQPLTPQQAARLLAMRRSARKCYADFLRYWIEVTHQPLMWGWHMEYLADIMQGVAERDPRLQFLIVNIPPRMLKSTLLSQMWQAWMIGVEDNARSSLFSISSSANLACRDSRITLDVVRSEWYQHLFPGVTLGSKETEAEWWTKGGSYRIACGRDGTVTGRGAHHIIVDDLVSAKEGDSEVIREEGNNFLGRSLRSRLDDQRTGTITNIQQRLHERDATGFLLEQAKRPGADQYHHIVLPNEAPSRTIVAFGGKTYATRNQGDLLHPAYLGPKETAAIKAAMRHDYDGQYQQNPVKMEGGHLDPRRLLKLQGSALEIKSRLGLTPVFYLDFAATEKQTQKNDPDFSCIEVWARDQLGRLICLDIWRKQTADYAVMARTLIHMHKLWRPRFTKGERGALINLFQPVLTQQMTLAGHFLTLEPLPARRTDKVERSMPYQGMLNAGMVAVPEAAPWLPDFEAEHRGFPNGAHDDQLDPAFDAATDYQTLPRGETPATHPSDPAVLLSDEVKERIEKARTRQLNPIASDPDDW
jgi:predicted phage terminase large subunit-like protein